jgi:F-type H+-transporting ATPase subunit gamma
MTRRQDLGSHRRSLGEIREIMNSMKTLAYLETRKLNRLVEAQQAVLSGIETVAADFAAFHPEALPGQQPSTEVYLLVGSERGFCRDFNPRVLEHLQSRFANEPSAEPLLIAVGHKLHALLEGDRRVAARVEGANVAEEVFPVLQALVAELTGLQGTLGPSTVYAIYHSVGEDLVTRPLLPPYWQGGEQAARHRHPPLLNLPPEDFIVGLTEHYLFAALHAMLYASLLAENQVRVSHLEGAVTYLDDESQRITHRCHTLRQEEIIEEIEVILLSASSVEEASYGR